MQSSLYDILYSIFLLLSRGYANYFVYFFLFFSCFLPVPETGAGETGNMGYSGILFLCSALPHGSLSRRRKTGEPSHFFFAALSKKGEGQSFRLSFLVLNRDLT